MTAPVTPPSWKAVALMFPGQGSQFPGMAMDLVKESSRARELIELADDIMGYRLSGIMAGEKGDELNRTVHTQPAVFVHSMALLEVLRERCVIDAVFAAGHSLGEYSALCAAGVLTFPDALEIVRIRARGMDEAQPPGTCGMAAIVGLSRDQARALVEQSRLDDVLEAANFNAPDQVVVSGRLAAVERTVEATGRERRAKAIMLPVSSAFHTKLMEPARRTLADRLTTVNFGEPGLPVIANVDARVYPASGEEVRERLLEQLVRPVLWEDCVRFMIDNGAQTFVEVGPGKVLTGLLRRIDRRASGMNVSDPAGIRAFAEASA